MIAERLRQTGRRLLPDLLRKPLGRAIGRVYQHLVRPLLGWIFDISGGRFRVDGCTFDIPRDLTTRAYRSCFVLGDYEREERALIREYLRPTDRVLETGACLGIVSCTTNRLLAPPVHHVVVEGNPELIPWIERNRDLNGCNFAVEHCAISSQAEVTFYLHPEFIVGGTAHRPSPRPVQVRGRTLQQLHDTEGPFDTLVMDIEGAELEALEPFAATLRNYRLVIVELHPWAIGDDGVRRCQEIFAAAGLSQVGKAELTEAWVRG